MAGLRTPDRYLARTETILRALGFGAGLGFGGLLSVLVALIQYLSGRADHEVFSAMIGGVAGFLIGLGARSAADVLAGLTSTQLRLARIEFALSDLVKRVVRIENHLEIPTGDDAAQDSTPSNA